MKLGDRYNWIGQQERLIYIGKEGNWHQFALVDKPNEVWCEVLDSDLSMLEETKQPTKGLDVNRALIIKQPWIDLILSGQKTWEMRSRPTNIRERIGLIEQGTGLIIGEAELVDSFIIDHPENRAFTHSMLDVERRYHHINDVEMLKKYRYAWELKNVKRYDKPIPYNHPQGAVVWVKLL